MIFFFVLYITKYNTNNELVGVGKSDSICTFCG
jgi:hypothetical protein